MRQQELDNMIVSLENDMMLLTKATLSELDYLRKELESTSMWIKPSTKKIIVLQIELAKSNARIIDNSNAVVIVSFILLYEMERYLALYQQTVSE